MRDVHSIVVYAEIDRIPGYCFGTDGSIYSKSKSKLLNVSYVDKDGYCLVHLKDLVVYRVHRLILEAFVGECPNGMEACHDNDIPNDNRLANLRWDYPKNNSKDRIKNGSSGKGTANAMASLTDEKVIQLRKDRETGMTYYQLGDKYGISFQHASLIVNRKRWDHI